jgi:hypothetical protein
MNKLTIVFLSSLLLTLTACGSSDVVYEGIRHPQTSSTEITFQEHTIPEGCFAFAHLLMNTKANSQGQDLGNAMRAEAMDKGADLVLIGLAREDEGAELEVNRFDYYGPEYSYNFNRTWLGWKFGFEEWNGGGELIGFGANVSDNREKTFPHTMMVQAVFLRCEAN